MTEISRSPFLHSTGSSSYGAVVIGGGFYGARLALTLRRRGLRVLLVEREATLLARASTRNQARVHNGYHYPRSILTSLRSRLNYRRFLDEYRDCVHAATHYYAVARGMSKVSAGQFVEFCKRIEAPLAQAPPRVTKLFDASRIDAAALKAAGVVATQALKNGAVDLIVGLGAANLAGAMR